jgi:glycerol kinase
MNKIITKSRAITAIIIFAIYLSENLSAQRLSDFVDPFIGATIELFDTDSAAGAAKGAGFGAGIYASLNEAFDGLTKITSIEPETNLKDIYEDAYNRWKEKF